MTRQFWDSICNGWSHRLHQFANCFFDPAASFQNPEVYTHKSKRGTTTVVLNFFWIPREFSWLISPVAGQEQTNRVVVFSPGRPAAVSGKDSASSNKSPKASSGSLAVLDTIRMWSLFLGAEHFNDYINRNLKQTRGTRKKVTQKWAYTRWTFKNLRETQSWCFLKICLRWSAYLIEHQQGSL